MPPWKAKVVAQQVFSRMPSGHRVNYVFQRRVTGGLPIGDDTLRRVIDVAAHHVQNIERFSTVPIESARFYEFGAGWDLHVAQVLYCFGAERQVVVDIRRLLRTELAIEIGNRLAVLDAPLPRRPPRGGTTLEAGLASMGIEYRAPCDARATGMEPRSVDVITSTNTLEHIPAGDIRLILEECRRILTDDGAMSFQIDYKDHYSYFDSRISAYNYLRYDERQWKRFNPGLHYQNRLRHSDYLALFTEAGFEVVDAVVDEGGPEHCDEIRDMEVAEPFSAYSVEDLAARKSVVVLTKCPSSVDARRWSE